MKFSQKIVAASSTILLVTVIILSIQQISAVRHEVESLVNTSLTEMVNGVKNTVVSEMNSKKSLAQSITEVLEFAPHDHRFIKQTLENPELKSSFLAIGFGYQSDGFLIENDDNWEAGTDYDPRARPWYRETKAKGGLVVTAPYVDALSKQIIISIGTPVVKDGQFIAGMFYDMSLVGLADLVNNVSLLNSGYLFIVDEDGTTIAHPQDENNGKNLNTYLPGTKIQAGNQKLEQKGKNLLVHFEKVPSENWYIGAIIDEDIAFSSIYDMRKSSTIYAMIAAALSFIALSLLIKVLMKPLVILNDAIQDAASGQGDLTKRLDTNTDLEFSQLATGFNSFTETLQKQIQQSKDIAGKILLGTEETVMGAQESSAAMNLQLEELEQLATAMNEMAVTAIEVTNNAQSAAAVAKEADNAALEGSSLVSDTTKSIDALFLSINQAVKELKNLELATENIESVLKVINEIADKTNLLALNAAIESSRAGDSGRGFAVVADEVRNLATRTQESTTEIRCMIEQLQSGSSLVTTAMLESKNTALDVVEKSQTADAALQRIRKAIQRINNTNELIASSAEEQSSVAEDINNKTVNIKDLSNQVAASAEEANIAMQIQAENVRKQDVILNKFIV